jgi:N-acetylglutamate synthase-like GNAT family acetyltransferase
MAGVPAMVWLAGTPQEWSGAAVLYPIKPNATAWILVRPPCRGSGAGTALLEMVVDAARQMGCEGVRTPTPLSENVSRWLEKHNFICFEQVQEYSLLIDETLPRLEKAWTRVGRSMPATAELITLDEADKRGLGETVSRLFSRTVGGLPMHLARLIHQVRQGQPAPLDLEQSLVLLDKGLIIGASHTHYDHSRNCWYTDSIAVVEPYRRGWANILLRMERLKRIHLDGRSNESRFRFRDSQRDTSRFADHVGATKTEELSLMECRLKTLCST